MTGARRAGALLRLLATIAALVAGELALWHAGSTLPPLPLDRAALSGGVGQVESLALAAAVVRVAALAAGAGLLATTALGIAARCCGAVRLVARLDRWTPPSLRRLLDAALGAGLAATIGLGAMPATASDDGTAATLRRLADDAATTTTARFPDDRAVTTTTLRRLPDVAPPPARVGDTTLRRLPDARPPPPPEPAADPPEDGPAPPPPAAAAPAPTGWSEIEVAPGESFWHLAERHEAQRLGRPPTEREIGACWQALVAVNRHRLVVPGDPDLIFPGQRLLVPCP